MTIYNSIALLSPIVLDFMLVDDLLVILPGRREACTQIMADMDGLVEDQEIFSLSFVSNFIAEESSSTTIVHVTDSDSKNFALGPPFVNNLLLVCIFNSCCVTFTTKCICERRNVRRNLCYANWEQN